MFFTVLHLFRTSLANQLETICFFPWPLLSSKDWEDAGKIARKFQIGVKESGAISNLICRIPKKVAVDLYDAVRARGMRFVTHEAIQKDLFNTGFTSGVGSWEAWKAECCNKHDDALVNWLT